MDNNFKNVLYNAASQIKEVNEKAQQEINEIQKPVIKESLDVFSRLGWNKWSEEELESNSQYIRIEKSITDKMELISIDRQSSSGQVKGSTVYDVSGNGCTCRDFVIRRKPCKHMYFLAMQLCEEEASQGLQLTLDDEDENQSATNSIDLGTLGCCSLYRDCSKAGHCLQNDDYYKKCAYRNNIEKGMIFYTEKANNFNQERYNYIEGFRISLDEERRKAFDEILVYFEKTKRGSRRCLCLNSPLIADISKTCNAFNLMSAKDLVKYLFEKDLISNRKAAELHEQHSKLPAPEIAPLPPLLPKGSSPKEQDNRQKQLQDRIKRNSKVWENHFMLDPDLQNVLSKAFLYFTIDEYNLELDEYFLNNCNTVSKNSGYLIFFDDTEPNIFKKRIN